MRWIATVTAVFLTIGTPGVGEDKNPREAAVRGDRGKMPAGDRWIYNDLDAAFLLAEKQSKPVLVVLRCVPCKACTGIDESVLKAKKLQELLDQFVCVRVINANALDLSRFQFDYDLSFSTLQFHPDGTLYGRYGSWQHQLDEMDTTIDGFEQSLRKTLAIHRDYPSNRDALAPKQGGPTPFATPIEIPGLAGKYERALNWDGNVVQSCVHCHQIGDAYRAWYRSRRESIPEDLVYPMPEPETVGLRIDGRSGTRVLRVEEGSIASRSGIVAGDDLQAIEGAPITSVADIAWSLHRAPEAGRILVTVARDQTTLELPIELPQGWRRRSDISSRVGTWQMRAMALGGMVLKSLPAAKRRSLGIEAEEIGLMVQHVGEYGEHAAAKREGFRKGDILLSLDGFPGPRTESELIGDILEKHREPTQLSAEVLRGEERLRLLLPIQ